VTSAVQRTDQVPERSPPPILASIRARSRCSARDGLVGSARRHACAGGPAVDVFMSGTVSWTSSSPACQRSRRRAPRCGRPGWGPAPADRQPRHRDRPARPAYQPCGRLRRRCLWRLLLGDPGRAGTGGSVPLAAVRPVALAGDGVDGGAARPQHGHPRAQPADQRGRVGREPTPGPGGDHQRGGGRAPDPLLPGWAAQARRGGALVFADAGWDPTGAWDPAVLGALSGWTRSCPTRWRR